MDEERYERDVFVIQPESGSRWELLHKRFLSSIFRINEKNKVYFILNEEKTKALVILETAVQDDIHNGIQELEKGAPIGLNLSLTLLAKACPSTHAGSRDDTLSKKPIMADLKSSKYS